MTISKHPKLILTEMESEFIRNPTSDNIEALLQYSFCNEISPSNSVDLMGTIRELSKTNKLRVYDFLINKIEKQNKENKSFSLSSDERLAKEALDNLKTATAELESNKSSIEKSITDESHYRNVEDYSLLSYLEYPYLGNHTLFQKACKNIDRHIKTIFSENSTKKDHTKIVYASQELHSWRLSVIKILLDTENWDDKRAIVLICNCLQDEPFVEEKLKNIRYDYTGFDKITSSEKQYLTAILYPKLPSSCNGHFELAALRYGIQILTNLGFEADKVNKCKIDSINRTLISSDGIVIDFDFILELIQELCWNGAVTKDVFEYGNILQVKPGSFFDLLENVLRDNPQLIEIDDYQSHLMFNCEYGNCDNPFLSPMSTIGYILSIFPFRMWGDNLAFISPYRYFLSEVDDGLHGNRSLIYANAVKSCLKEGYVDLGTDIFIVGILGYFPFLVDECFKNDKANNILNHFNVLIDSIKPVLQKEYRTEDILGAIEYFITLSKTFTKSSANFIHEISSVAAILKSKFSLKEEKIVPLLSELPFKLPKEVFSELDSYSKECLDQIKVSYNQFLGDENTARLAEEKIPLIKIQSSYHPIGLLLEYLAKKTINPYLKQKGLKSEQLGTLMRWLHDNTEIPASKAYKELCYNTKKDENYFKLDLACIRNYSAHSPSKKNSAELSENDYREFISKIVPELIIFFIRIKRYK